MAICGIRRGRVHWFFASRFNDLPAEREKKIKITEEEVGLEPERVHARHLGPRHTHQSNEPLQPSRFQSVIF